MCVCSVRSQVLAEVMNMIPVFIAAYLQLFVCRHRCPPVRSKLFQQLSMFLSLSQFQIVLGIEEPLAQRYIMEGSHYPEEMREALKPGVTRVSFPYFMSEEMVDFIIEAVKMTAREGWKLLPQVLTYTP